MISNLFTKLELPKFFENVILNTNMEAKGPSSSDVQKSIQNIWGEIASTVKAVMKVGKTVFQLAKTIATTNTTKENRSVLEAKDTCLRSLENFMGDSVIRHLESKGLIDMQAKDLKIVKEVGSQILQQSDCKDKLEFDFFIQSDNNAINAHVIPGGKIVITDGLLDALRSQGNTPENEFKQKLAVVLSYLVARASAEQKTQKAKTAYLTALIEKVMQVSFTSLFPTRTANNTEEAKQASSKEEIRLAAIRSVIEKSIYLGSDVLLRNRETEADTQARKTALTYLGNAGYEMTEEDLDATLKLFVVHQDSEQYEEEIATSIGKIILQATRIRA